MIHGFVIDEAFYPPGNSLHEIDDNISNGYLKRESYSYFVKPDDIKDVRDTRLHMFSEPLTAHMKIIHDIDDAFIEPELVTFIKNAPTENKECLFNIIEFLFYRTVTFTRDELNDELINDNTSFSNYIPDSLIISVKTNEVNIYDNANTLCDIMEWVQFDIDINGIVETFKLWINDPAFRDDYPLSTITETIFPLSNAELLDPSSLVNIYEAVNSSIAITTAKLHDKINEGNHTGYINFTTKYIDPDGGLYYLPFSILYKGRRPTSIEMRDMIRSLLDYVLADEAKWKTVLPDLFIDGRFYMIPMWDVLTREPNRDTYPSVMPLNTMVDKLGQIMNEYDKEYIKDHLEVISVSYIESPIGIIKDENNITDVFVSERHPTYQYYSSHDASFQYQEALTRAFNTQLNKVLSAAAGESTLTNIATEELDGRVFLVFVIDGLEFMVISRASYLNRIGG